MSAGPSWRHRSRFPPTRMRRSSTSLRSCGGAEPPFPGALVPFCGQPNLGASGLTYMDPEDFRTAAHSVVDQMPDYLATVERRPVMPPITPGSLKPLFPASPPEQPEPLGAILDDYRRLVEPNATHWQHPGFMALFATTASAPGILGEDRKSVV